MFVYIWCHEVIGHAAMFVYITWLWRQLSHTRMLSTFVYTYKYRGAVFENKRKGIDILKQI